MQASLTATAELAEYAASLRYEDLPADVVRTAKQGILDWTGVALAGSREPIAGVVHRVLAQVGGGAGASVVGYPAPVPAPFAALANGTIGHALDLDDTHLEGKLHVTAVVLPAVLAIADTHGLSGRDVITAYVAGFEAAATLAVAAGPEHYEAGWHATGTMGTLGAAVAAARALGLPAEATVRAMGLAGTQSSGVQRVFGTMAKPFNAGRAAMSGCLAAFLAAEGMTAPDDVLDGPRGVFDLLGAGSEARSSPIGASWKILDNTVKLYACCHALHAGIEAALRLRAAIETDWQSVEAVEVSGWPTIANIAAIRTPATGYEAKFSLYHAIAAALVEGAAGPAQFTAAALADERIRRVAEKVAFRPDSTLDIRSAEVVVVLPGGRRRRESTDAVAGTVGAEAVWPLLERKFLDCAGPTTGDVLARATLDRIKNIERAETVAPFWALG